MTGEDYRWLSTWDRLIASITDEEILTPGVIREFSCGGLVCVHEVHQGQVYHARCWPNSDWELVRTPTDIFLQAYRRELAK